MKWIILIAVAYMLWRMFESEKRKKREKEQQERKHLAATGELVQDPVCGAYVDVSNAISVRDGESVHYFCGYDCRDGYLKQHGKPLPQAGSDDSPQ